MNKYLLLFVAIIAGRAFVNAQAPQTMPYQAVVRDASGNLLSNHSICIEFTIHKLTSNGTIEYQETQTTNTNNLGLFSLNIGASTATVISGTFVSINWTAGAKFMEVGYDSTGTCSGFMSMGASQMMSVPYALYAGSAASATGAAGGDLTGNYPNPTIAANKVTLPDLATLSANSVIGNNTNSTATPVAVPMFTGATASSVGIRDANANLSVNNSISNRATTATAGGTTTLTAGSAFMQQFTGTLGQTVVLPNATTLAAGQSFFITNRSTGTVTVETNGGAVLQTMADSSQSLFTVITNSAVAGTWDVAYSLASTPTPAWDLAGNTINAAGYWIGTTASSNSAYGSCIFKVSGTAAGLLDNGTYGNETFWGLNAGAVNINASNPGNNGNYNVGIGTLALTANTTGSWNTAVGYQSLYTNTTGSYNVAIGMHALNQNIYGQYNTVTGVEAALYTGYTSSGGSTGNNNSIYGYQSLYSNYLGSNNTAVGYQALYSTSAGNNTALGYSAGSNITTGTANTVIGYKAQANAGLTNATALGANASVTASNSLVLGSAVNVGIGITAPAGTLDVEGGTAAANAAGINIKFVAQNGGTGNTNGGNILLTPGTGTGTGVAGAIEVGSALTLVSGLNPIATVNSSSSRPLFEGNSGNLGVMIGYLGNDIQGRSGASFVTNGNLLLNPFAGNVGIGSQNAPTSTLTVTGSMAANTVIETTTTYAPLATDFCIIFRGVANTCSLPTASGCPGRIYSILNQGTGTLTLTTAVNSNTGTITSLATGTGNLLVISDGTAWNKIN